MNIAKLLVRGVITVSPFSLLQIIAALYGQARLGSTHDIYPVKIFNGVKARQAVSINLRNKERQARPAEQQQKRLERHQEVLRKSMAVFTKNMAG
jgi:predicted membrane chloride channel (bestrophin family)